MNGSELAEFFVDGNILKSGYVCKVPSSGLDTSITVLE